MYETEIKILGIDRKEVEGRLVSSGAVKVFDGDIHALYYDTAEGSIRQARGAFRLRKEDDIAVLTYKAHISDNDAKIRQEKEVRVSDFGTMRSILESTGFSVWLEMEKHRTTYELGAVHFELDKYHGAYEYIPEFLEIEGPDIETVYASASMLGFQAKDCRPWDSYKLAQYYSSGGSHANVTSNSSFPQVKRDGNPSCRKGKILATGESPRRPDKPE